MRKLWAAVAVTVSLGAGSPALACPGSGVEVAGSCWYLGAPGESCADACESVGAGYDQATRTYAGSGGSDGQCAAVLDALAVPGSGATATTCNGGGFGCNFVPGQGGFRGRCGTPATDPVAAELSIQRACACLPPMAAPTMGWTGLAAMMAALTAIGARRLRRRA